MDNRIFLAINKAGEGNTKVAIEELGDINSENPHNPNLNLAYSKLFSYLNHPIYSEVSIQNGINKY